MATMKTPERGYIQQGITQFSEGLSPISKAELALVSAAMGVIGDAMKAGGAAMTMILDGRMPSPMFGDLVSMTPELSKAAIAYAKVSTSKKRGRFTSGRQAAVPPSKPAPSRGRRPSSSQQGKGRY